MKTVLMLLLFAPVVAWAQGVKVTSADLSRKQSYLLLRDGTVLRGRIMRQDSTIITVRRKDGELSFVEADLVARIQPRRPADRSTAGGFGSFTDRSTVFVLKDGTRLPGRFVRRDSTMITVRKQNGQLTYFEPELLVRVDTVGTALDGRIPDGAGGVGERVFANRFSPWLLTGRTAYNAEKGRFYYRSTLAVLNEFDYGITRNWSVGASFATPIPYLILADFYAFNGFLVSSSRLFTTLSVPLGKRFRIGIHADYQDRQYGGINRGPLTYQALATVGSGQRNVTLGAGLIDRGKRRTYVAQPPYSSTMPTYVDAHIPNQLFLTLGIVQKVAPGLTLLSDNRISPGAYNTYYYDASERVSLSFACRLDRRRHAFDIGLYGLVYRDNVTFNDSRVRLLPYLGYNLLIGRD